MTGQRPPDPYRETVAGYWYYGANCPYCGDFQYLIYDDDQGKGVETIHTGPPKRWRCETCGREAMYALAAMRRTQAPFPG